VQPSIGIERVFFPCAFFADVPFHDAGGADDDCAENIDAGMLKKLAVFMLLSLRRCVAFPYGYF
jgi:hypothetical protein